MSDLIPMDQAAKMLRMSSERLKEMISSNQIFAYRDGASWKFKLTEIERFADEFAIDLGPAPSEKDDSGSFFVEESSDDLVLADESSSGSIADSEFEFSDSDLILDDSSLGDSSDEDSLGDDLMLEESREAISLEDSSDRIPLGESKSEDDDDLLFGDSSLDLALNDDDVEAKVFEGGADPESVFDDDLLMADGTGSTGKILKNASQQLEDSKSSMEVVDDDLFDDELKLADSDSLNDAIDLSSDFEDSDVVLEDSDSSSELVLEDNDDGFQLSAADSGISLSDSLKLGGSDIDDLELPDDDMVSLADAADSDAATMMQEDDFNLTPFEDDGADETSGSQVIALDDSDLFAGDSESTLLGDGDLATERQFEPEVPVATVAPVGVPVGQEFPFTLWPVLSLTVASMFMALGLAVAYDVAKNLWLPNENPISGGVLSWFSGILGG